MGKEFNKRENFGPNNTGLQTIAKVCDENPRGYGYENRTVADLVGHVTECHSEINRLESISRHADIILEHGVEWVVEVLNEQDEIAANYNGRLDWLLRIASDWNAQKARIKELEEELAIAIGGESCN